MMIAVSRCHPTFFAETGGVDLILPMTSSWFGEIDVAFNEHAVLLFRDQNVTGVQQVAFSALFGSVFVATKYAWRNEKQRLRAEMADISNIDHSGERLAADDQRRLRGRANQLWHTDNTFKQIPARCCCCRRGSFRTAVATPNSPICVPLMPSCPRCAAA